MHSGNNIHNITSIYIFIEQQYVHNIYIKNSNNICIYNICFNICIILSCFKYVLLLYRNIYTCMLCGLYLNSGIIKFNMWSNIHSFILKLIMYQQNYLDLIQFHIIGYIIMLVI